MMQKEFRSKLTDNVSVGIQKQLVVLLRDSRYFSQDDLHKFWQEFVDPTVDWGVIIKNKMSQAEIAGDLVAHVTRGRKIPNLVEAVCNQREDFAGLLGVVRWKGRDDSLISSAINLIDDFVEIPSSTFWMGCNDNYTIVEAHDKPQHEFTIPYDFWVSRYTVTYRQYSLFLQKTQHEANEHCLTANLNDRMDYPVVYVSWYDAVEYCKWLTQIFRSLLEPGYAFRLPSEAEWELASRGYLPSRKKYPWGNHWESAELPLCNSSELGLLGTKPVGEFSPHGDSYFGIADMVGNVREWTRSIWGKTYSHAEFEYPYKLTDDRESFEAPDNYLRVARGGSFADSKDFVTCSYRYRHFPTEQLDNLGFRVVISLINPNIERKKLDINSKDLVKRVSKFFLKKKTFGSLIF